MNMELKPNFTPRAQEVIAASRKLALAYNKRVVNEDHLSLALCKVSTQALDLLFDNFSIDKKNLTIFISKRLKKSNTVPNKKSYFSGGYKSILGGAVLEAEKHEHDYIGVEHILLSIFNKEDSPISSFFSQEGVSLQACILTIRSQFLISAASSETLESSRLSSEKQYLSLSSSNPEAYAEPQSKQGKASLKSNYFHCMNHKAAAGKYDEVIGRDKEIEDIAEVLCRRSKNNPILLGEPGVGKTAVVEGLVQEINKGQVTEFLYQKRVYSLDLAGMIAGTKYRGQFEERLKATMEEIQKDENAVLFIDEIHSIVGAGSAEGTMDAANILKPILARGEIMCIGATTQDEYRKTILKDGALDRRFQPIHIDEPDEKSCLNILYALKSRYESFHGVEYPNELLEQAIKLSSRYILDRQLPDKAIDLIDQAGAKAKITAFKRPEAALKIEEEMDLLYAKEETSSEPNVIMKKRDALMKKYQTILEEWAEKTTSQDIIVSESELLQVVSQKTGVPVEDISMSEADKFLNLSKQLKSIVIGQEKAIQTISESIIRNKAGLKDEEKPIGSFLFLGSSGVGKTYLAKQVALLAFGDKKSLIHLDMSEFSEQASTAKFTGAAPGYVGFDSSGAITEKVRKKPHAVLLFDEIEKAHEDVVNLLLQILEEGRLTDSSGRLISFRNTIIILTGNIGGALTKKSNQVGFAAASDSKEAISENIKAEARKKLKPELVNRIESFVVFENFSKSDLLSISRLEFEKSLSKVKDKISQQTISKSVYEYIANKAEQENDGARPIKHIIKKEFENELAKKILINKSFKSLKLKVSVFKNSLKINLI